MGTRKNTFDLPVAFTNYKVTTVKRLKNASGMCHIDKRTIQIAPATNADNWRATLWHEYFHALMHELGREDLCNDEAFIEGLALSIMRVRNSVPDL